MNDFTVRQSSLLLLSEKKSRRIHDRLAAEKEKENMHETGSERAKTKRNVTGIQFAMVENKI